MKKIFYLFTCTALLLALMISCKDDHVTGIVIDKKGALLLYPGATATLKANLQPYGASAKVIWSSGDTHIVTVESDNGKVSISECLITAKAVGTTEITVTTKDGSHSATYTVQVVDVEPELVAVEGGTFTMGCTDGESYDNEFPVHQVTLSSYKIAKYEVTQLQWEELMGKNPSHYRGYDLPVEMVSWHDVQEFITKLNTVTGKNYRLPTEAEWEYAARGGSKSERFKYSGGNTLNAVAWYKGNSNDQTHPVGTKAPNELRIYDMSGNVFEWCNDWYGAYTADSQTNPPGPDSGDRRIARGGDAINLDLYFCRVSFRISALPGNSGANLGFRLASNN
jgi:formylglycine-generating enzyme required for sulfatase activity